VTRPYDVVAAETVRVLKILFVGRDKPRVLDRASRTLKRALY